MQSPTSYGPDPTHSNLTEPARGIVSSVPPALCTGGIAMVSGSVFYSIFQAPRNRDLIGVITRTRGTAAGATPTLCRVGLCTVEFDTDGIPTFDLVARIANDTAQWAGTFANYFRSFDTAGGFPAEYPLRGGDWYAGAALCVTAAAAPLLYGTGSALTVQAEDVAGSTVVQTGQTDIPLTHTPANRADYAPTAYVGLV